MDLSKLKKDPEDLIARFNASLKPKYEEEEKQESWKQASIQNQGKMVEQMSDLAMKQKSIANPSA